VSSPSRPYTHIGWYYLALVTGMILIGYAMMAFAYVTWPDAVRGIVGTFAP